MKKKLAFALACVLLLGSLAGCGSKKEETSGDSAGTIKIGYFGPADRRHGTGRPGCAERRANRCE